MTIDRKIDRKIRKKHRIWKTFIAVVLTGYLLFLGWIEWFCRQEWQLWPARQVVLWPSAAIRAASRTFAESDWEEVVGGIVLFLPVGILAPLLVKRIRHGWLLFLFLLVLGMITEFGRWLGGAGSFVLDYVVGHMLGGWIGYGLYRIVACLWAIRSRKRFVRELQEKRSYKESRRQEENRRELDRKARVLPAVLAQIPLAVTVLFFVGIFVEYREQAFGNLACDYAARVGLSDTRITVRSEFSDKRGRVGVYSADGYDKDRAAERAMELLEMIGREAGVPEPIDDGHIRCRDMDQEAELWLDLAEGTYTLTDYSRRKKDNEEPVEGEEGADEEAVRSALARWGCKLPNGGKFREVGGGTYAFDYDNCVEDGRFYSGSVFCDYHVSKEVSRLDWQLPEYRFFGEGPVISEQEAYEELISGKFYAVGYESGRGIYRLEINGMGMSYSLDSKGYYQPVYRVNAVVNGQDTSIDLPALAGGVRRKGISG